MHDVTVYDYKLVIMVNILLKKSLYKSFCASKYLF